MTSFIKRAFPRYNIAQGVPSITPDTALVFWLGGATDGNGNFIGFSANPQNPFDTSAARIGPYYDFDKTRIGPLPFPGAGLGTVGGIPSGAQHGTNTNTSRKTAS